MSDVPPATVASALYTGRVRHRRFTPVEHSFRYRLFYAYLDLDEAPSILRAAPFASTRGPALAWLRRRDHFGDPARPLVDCARERIAEATGRPFDGPVRLLTHLRMFGHVFNPVSFYFAFDRAPEGGESLRGVLAEVTSTPWRERHVYALDVADAVRAGDAFRFTSEKALHVSPFLPMDMTYAWTIAPPGEKLAVHVATRRGGDRCFDATLALLRRPLDRGTLALALASFPWLTLRVLAAIYYEAFRLRRKRAPFHAHPRHLAPRRMPSPSSRSSQSSQSRPLGQPAPESGGVRARTSP